ncbi:MAG: NUDIX hydrolase [Thermomicrobia bacterium]|nr:NUDIX hydrolase [Thermomicrobia bacterium]MCA1723357.1 NUDIX hydrolase [Thermomicrobia bacterium]
MSISYAMAAGFALRDADGRLLLIHQAYGNHLWDFVGGGAEAGEAPAETAIREAKEELGLTVVPRGLIGVYFNRPRCLLVFIFAGIVTGGTLTLQADEIAAVGWFGPDDLPPMSAWKARQTADVFDWTGEAFLRTRE